MIQILTFEKAQTNKTVVIDERGIKIYGANLYHICDNEEIIGRFATNRYLSYGKLKGQEIIVEHKFKVFRRPRAFVKDALTGEQLGQIEWRSYNNMRMKLTIAGHYRYSWKNISIDFQKLFDPKTWSTQVMQLTNALQSVIISGKFQNKRIEFRTSDLIPVSGQIEFTEPFEPLLPLCVLYMFEVDTSGSDG